MAPVDDAALIDLVETYEQSFEEAQSPLVREMEAGGGVAGRRRGSPARTTGGSASWRRGSCTCCPTRATSRRSSR